jgi:biopolymer transport protein ExbB/biopolymer transport protein TolQ
MVKWNLFELWNSMSPLCHGVVVVLVIMFLRSFVVTGNRLMRYRLARIHSQRYIEQSHLLFREGKLDQAISAAEQNRKSHIASVVCAGLLDYQAAPPNLPDHHIIEGVERSLERSSAETNEEMKRGLSGLATIAATAPFVGLFGTVIGILNAFSNISG